MQLVGMSLKIADYIAARAKPKIESFEKKAVRERKKVDDQQKLAELEQKLSEELEVIESKFDPANWLTDAARRAKQITLATHPIKYTNSLIKREESSCCHAVAGSKHPIGMSGCECISTASIAKPVVDVTGNAGALDVASLLLLEEEGKTLINYIEDRNAKPLKPFAQNNEQLREWISGLQQALTNENLSSHKLAKQIYFPIEQGKYHLLSPLYSSSLSEEIYTHIIVSRFSEEAKSARKAKNKSIYHDMVVIDYPRTAIQTFGGTKPRNISNLNQKRGGRSFLLSCAPPVWESQLKPPVGVKTVFSYNCFGRQVRRHTWFLQQYLLRKKNWPSTVEIRDFRKERVDEIVDQLVQYGAEIRNLEHFAGWTASSECRLNRAEQLWLDPHRAEVDEDFAMELEKNDWLEIVADNFGGWLNRRLKHKKMTLGDAERREWKAKAKEALEVFS